jgi:hypothetical protein
MLDGPRSVPTLPNQWMDFWRVKASARALDCMRPQPSPGSNRIRNPGNHPTLIWLTTSACGSCQACGNGTRSQRRRSLRCTIPLPQNFWHPVGWVWLWGMRSLTQKRVTQVRRRDADEPEGSRGDVAAIAAGVPGARSPHRNLWIPPDGLALSLEGLVPK